MTVTYELTPSDMQAFGMYLKNGATKPSEDKEKRLVRAAMAAIFVYMAIPTEHNELRWLAALLVFVAILDSTRRRARRQRGWKNKMWELPGAQERLFTQQIVSITDRGLHCASPNGERTIFWTGIVAVDTTEHHLFIKVAHGPAVIIPTRAFVTPEEQAEFVATLEARRTPPSAPSPETTEETKIDTTEEIS